MPSCARRPQQQAKVAQTSRQGGHLHQARQVSAERLLLLAGTGRSHVLPARQVRHVGHHHVCHHLCWQACHTTHPQAQAFTASVLHPRDQALPRTTLLLHVHVPSQTSRSTPSPSFRGVGALTLMQCASAAPFFACTSLLWLLQLALQALKAKACVPHTCPAGLLWPGMSQYCLPCIIWKASRTAATGASRQHWNVNVSFIDR